MSRVIDCDVHCAPGSVDDLAPFLEDHWVAYLVESGFRAPRGLAYTFPRWSDMLATPAPDAVEERVLPHAEHTILHAYFGVESLQHPYLAPALATAVNEWTAERLAADERLLASLVITPQFTQAAVDEIERVAGNPRFVQLLLPVRALEPYGTQRYWPIWEAAERHGLAIGIHYGGATARPPTAVGWVDSLFEEYALATQIFQAQVTSLVIAGVFVRFPKLKLVLHESGWTWMPSLMWRADREWKALRRETPWLDELPSDVIRRHVRMTTQPIDGPSDLTQLLEIVEQLGSDEMLMYASDRPHRYADDGGSLLERLSHEQVERIMWRNAWECHGLAARNCGDGQASAGP